MIDRKSALRKGCPGGQKRAQTARSIDAAVAWAVSVKVAGIGRGEPG